MGVFTETGLRLVDESGNASPERPFSTPGRRYFSIAAAADRWWLAEALPPSLVTLRDQTGAYWAGSTLGRKTSTPSPSAPTGRGWRPASWMKRATSTSACTTRPPVWSGPAASVRWTTPTPSPSVRTAHGWHPAATARWFACGTPRPGGRSRSAGGTRPRSFPSPFGPTGRGYCRPRTTAPFASGMPGPDARSSRPTTVTRRRSWRPFIARMGSGSPRPASTALSGSGGRRAGRTRWCSTAMPGPSRAWPSRRMAGASSRRAMTTRSRMGTGRSGSGRRPLRPHCPSSPATPAMSTRWRTAPTAAGSPPVAGTRRSACGTRPPARPARRFRTQASSSRWPSRPMAPG